MYATTYESEPTPALPGEGSAYVYDEPVGPALPSGDVTDELLADVAEDQIVSINQDALRRSMPAAPEYGASHAIRIRVPPAADGTRAPRAAATAAATARARA